MSPAAPAPIDAEAAQRVRQIVARSGSSFLWGMRVLPRPRREAMYAIYAFCREVDDIADGSGEADTQMRQLGEWRDEIEALYAERPARPVARALAPAVTAFALPREEFLDIIEGMEMDVADTMRAPAAADLEVYCRRVAGAVGLLSIRAFGAEEPEAHTLALVLGRALQLHQHPSRSGRGRRDWTPLPAARAPGRAWHRIE